MKEMIENTAALLAVGTIFAVGFLILTLPLAPDGSPTRRVHHPTGP